MAATLADIAQRDGPTFLGERSVSRLGRRFPLLIKLIDAADWLSLQVHPDDMVAARLTNGASLGKTEAWVVVDAQPGAELVIGPRPGLRRSDLLDRIESGALAMTDCQTVAAEPGDIWLVPAGTLHAIGSGTFIYEVEQPADLTYRVSDWGRPQTASRTLHPREALAAIDPVASAERVGRRWEITGGELVVPQFRLRLVRPGASEVVMSVSNSLHVVTTLLGSADLHTRSTHERLGPTDAVVIACAASSYSISGGPGTIVAVADIPEGADGARSA